MWLLLGSNIGHFKGIGDGCSSSESDWWIHKYLLCYSWNFYMYNLIIFIKNEYSIIKLIELKVWEKLLTVTLYFWEYRYISVSLSFLFSLFFPHLYLPRFLDCLLYFYNKWIIAGYLPKLMGNSSGSAAVPRFDAARNSSISSQGGGLTAAPPDQSRMWLDFS